MQAKIIVLFNHKGGVSKTTTTFNVAWKLTDLGKRVLLVDGDSQCNLTSLLLGDDFEDYYTNKTTKINNLKDAVSVAFEGKPRPIKAIDCYQAGNNDKLFLIPGHMDIAEYESALSFALNSNNALTTLQNLPGSFFELIRLCSEKYNVDYVFIDMNPGLSALNQTFFVSSDAFVVPTNPDPFSTMALKTLKTVLPRWKKWADTFRSYVHDASYPLPTSRMQFAGVIIQRFNLRKQKAAKPYQGRISEIKNYVENDLVNELSQNSMVCQNLRSLREDYCLAEIPEFGALIQKATDQRVPVFALPDENIGESGTVRDQMIAKRDQINEIFVAIARTILELNI